MAVIRPYTQQDRSAVRRIACDTAFMGKPAEVFFDDREVLADILTAYFTDYEPQSCFVAEQEHRVVGYLLGATDVRRISGIFFKKILPAVIVKIVMRGTLLKKRNLVSGAHLLSSFVKNEFKTNAALTRYPATLHINISEGFRACGIGAQLLEAYFAYLERDRIEGVYLATLSPRAAGFFEKNGFTLLEKTGRTYFRHYMPGQTLRCFLYGKIIRADLPSHSIPRSFDSGV